MKVAVCKTYAGLEQRADGALFFAGELSRQEK